MSVAARTCDPVRASAASVASVMPWLPDHGRSDPEPPSRSRTLRDLTLRTSLATLTMLLPAIAAAEPPDDGYCDYVEGSAAATAAPLFAPELYGMFGYIEQPAFAVTPLGDSSNLRAIGGLRYSVTNIFAGLAIKSRARADCRRHDALLALLSVRGATEARALAARLRVYEDAQREAERMLAEINADLEAKRATIPEATATRLRVEELRALAARTRSELAALPQADPRPLGTLMTAYRAADADLEASEGRLRTISAYDVSVRAGVERYIDGIEAETEYIALLQVNINLGALRIGSHNGRAARGRSRYARSAPEALGVDATIQQLRATLDAETKREVEVAALVTDLGRQIEALAKLGGEQNKRFRDTIWFDWIQAKAELAYLQAHVKTLRDVIAADAG